MRVVLIAVSATIVLVVGLGGGVEAASFPGESLTNSGAPTVDARYYRRHPSYYYRRGGDPSYTSRHCYNRDENSCSTADVARNELAAKHAVLPIEVHRTISKGCSIGSLR